MDEFRIDSHKMMYHPDRLSAWLKGERIYPLYAEVSPAGGCNHRCVFCAFDYRDYKTSFLDTGRLKKALKQMAQAGLKSVMYAGSGEPLLHKDMGEIICYTKSLGLDPAITTNGVLLDQPLLEKMLPALSWMRVSLDAAGPETYSRIHRCSAGDFGKVMDNLKMGVRLKKKKGYSCVIGAQLLLIRDNSQEVRPLVSALKKIGLDYLIVKPYSQHPQSRNNKCDGFNYEDYLSFNQGLPGVSNKNFKVILRGHTMRKLQEKRSYKNCLALPFWTYIDSSGEVYACSNFLGDKKYAYGNIYKMSFPAIWEGQNRKKILRFFADSCILAKCRKNCRMDEINRYLWELSHPPAHVNFI